MCNIEMEMEMRLNAPKYGILDTASLSKILKQNV